MPRYWLLDWQKTLRPKGVACIALNSLPHNARWEKEGFKVYPD